MQQLIPTERVVGLAPVGGVVLLEVPQVVGAGTSPIIRASGTKKVVLARYARKRRLGDVLQQWAFSAPFDKCRNTRRLKTGGESPKQRTDVARRSNTPKSVNQRKHV